MPTLSQTKRYLPFIIIIVLLVCGATVYALTRDESSPNPATNTSSKPGQEQPQQTSQPITVVGNVSCLTRSDTNGPHDMSCAIGLQTESGESYAISALDPTTTGSIPTGTRVEVTGSVTQQTSPYNIVGLITVSSIQRL